uniref:CLIP domain-containing serine protease n=1 Tax=Manduca sexta TaxID=7130 RepID=Q6Y2X4_MANSE|nr:prophenoloxidase-activating proteinase-3 precursor [Manduca sexta]
MANLVYVLLLASYFCFVSGQSCTTPNNGKGTCKSIYECEELLKLVYKKDRTQQDTDYLKKSQCGFMGNTPTVCCPNPCITPQGEPGQCVSIYECTNLANLLKPPITADTYNYVQKSRCQGADQYSVCCGSAPNFPSTGDCKASVSAFPPDPKSKCCGVDSRVGNKIIGGNATDVDQYPWLTIIEYVKTGPIKLLCGGVLISGKYVLTAGHCLTGPVLQIGTPTNVRLGEYNTKNDGADCVTVEAGGMDCTEGAVIVPIEKTIPHPEYNPISRTRRNDIGLIRLKEMAPFTDFIRPICLPSLDLTQAPPVNFTLYAAGWGAVSTSQPSSNVKLHVQLPFISYERCQPSYAVQNRQIELWEKQVCAGGEAGKDSCKGDSGGPLMYENGQTYEVIGIVSFGPTPCGMQDIPGVYTKVHSYKDWIISNIKP